MTRLFSFSSFSGKPAECKKPNRVSKKIAFILFFIAAACVTGLPGSALAQCDCTQTGVTGVPQIECEALVALYNGTNSALKHQFLIHCHQGVALFSKKKFLKELDARIQA